MTKYLLLRDNKESGPYSFDELRAKGLKAYDLVWVDGKSAAWRYPSEIEELMPFAPVVEEQPFDRFYKKPVSQNNASSYATTVPPRTVPDNQTVFSSFAPQAKLTTEPSGIPGKRIIYVTLPAGKGTAAIQKTNGGEALINKTPAPETTIAARTTGDVTVPGERETVRKQVEENFSHPSGSYDPAVEITPRPKKGRWSRILQPVAVILCVLALLAAGIFIGLSLNKDSLGLAKKVASNNLPVRQVSHTDPSPTVTVQPLSAAPGAQDPNVTNVPATAQTSSGNTGQPAGQELSRTGSVPASGSARQINAAAPTTVKVTDISAGKPAKALLPSTNKSRTSLATAPASFTASKDSVTSGLPALHREAVHRTDGSPDKDAIKNNIASLVTVGGNTYTVGTFGGISDLQVTVSNRSVYPLDLVVVEVEYVQANKKVFKTENLYFRGIGPGAALMMEAPKSTRGIKVQYKITLINSKELGLSYSAI